MAVVVLNLVVDRLTDVLASYDRIKVYRSTTGVAGPFPEITSAATRVVLLPDTIGYKFTDASGDETYYYQISYFNSVTSAESDRTDPVLGDELEPLPVISADPALDIMTVDTLKSVFLFGLDLTNDFGEKASDEFFAFYIRAAISWLEIYLDVAIIRRQITDERYDFIKQDYYKYVWLTLRTGPILSVDEVRLVLPTNQEVITYDPSWIHLRKESRQVNIVPGNGQLSSVLLGSSGAWLPIVYGWHDFLPDVFRVNYTVGYAPGTVPPKLLEMIGKLAAFGPLNVFGDITLGAGLQATSLSLDGLSQSVTTTNSSTNAGFGARILEYGKELKQELPVLRRNLHPVGMVVV
jgi:hypothetical protein